MKRIQSLIAIGLAGSIVFSATKPAYSQAQVLIPAAGAGVAGAVFVGIVIINKIAYQQWKKTDGTIFHTPVYSQDPGNIPGKQETHYAASAEGCQAMKKRFRDAGRNIRLVRIKPIRGGVICIFQGSDSQTGYYNDRR